MKSFLLRTQANNWPPSDHPCLPSLIAALGIWKLKATHALWQKSSRWITHFLANEVFTSALCDPNGPKLTLSHCSPVTSLKLEGCYEDLSSGFFFLSLDGVQEKKGASVPCGVAGCKSVLGWVCGWSSDPRQGAIMHWPLLSVHADVVAFFQLLFFSWDGTTGITIRTDKEMWVRALLPCILH